MHLPEEEVGSGPKTTARIQTLREVHLQAKAHLPAAAGTQEAARRGGVCGHNQGWVGSTDILAPGWRRRETIAAASR